MNIPAGYEVRVTSWENDGDNYNTKSALGCTKEKAQVLINILKVYTELTDAETTKYGKIMQKQFNDQFTEANGLEDYFMPLEDMDAQEDPEALVYFDYPINDIIYELVGYCEWGNRTVDDIEVFYHVAEVVDIAESFV